MDNLYGPPDKRIVHERVDMKEYFGKYCELLSQYEPCRPKSTKEVIMKFLQLTKSSDCDKIASYCSLQKYSVPDEPKPIDVNNSKKHPGLFDIPAVNPLGERKLKTLQILVKRNDEQEYVVNSKYIIQKQLGKIPKIVNLKPLQNIILIVRIYHPFKHIYGARSHRSPRCSQEIMLLSHQTLDCLRDKIICVNDLSFPQDVSERVNAIPAKKAKDIYPSGLFFIEDTFYVDMRQPNSKDYSKCIKDWAQLRSLKISAAKSKSMNEIKFIDLPIRLGYPYIYQHQGNCEHLILFSDARFLHATDPLSTAEYPLLLNIANQNSKYCMICGHYVARWICQNNSRLPFNLCYMCDDCFKSFNYKKGSKIGSFVAYQYTNPSAIV